MTESASDAPEANNCFSVEFVNSIKYILLKSKLNPLIKFVSPALKSVIGKKLHQQLYSYLRLGYWPQVEAPRTFNEKLIHRKLYTDNDLFTVVEDKWRVRDYVTEKVGEGILPELYLVTDDPSEIAFSELPEQYVIKPNHLSGGRNILVTGKDDFDEQVVRQQCRDWLDETYGTLKEEYWYKNISPRILIEEYINENGKKSPIDYKFMVFHGEVKFIHVTTGRKDDEETTRNFYDPNWNPIDVELYFPQGDGVPEPPNLDRMLQIAEQLAEPFDHIRVDLYAPNNDEIVFGELTVAESSGMNPFVPRVYDFKFGEHWTISPDTT